MLITTGSRGHDETSLRTRRDARIYELRGGRTLSRSEKVRLHRSGIFSLFLFFFLPFVFTFSFLFLSLHFFSPLSLTPEPRDIPRIATNSRCKRNERPSELFQPTRVHPADKLRNIIPSHSTSGIVNWRPCYAWDTCRCISHDELWANECNFISFSRPHDAPKMHAAMSFARSQTYMSCASNFNWNSRQIYMDEEAIGSSKRNEIWGYMYV